MKLLRIQGHTTIFDFLTNTYLIDYFEDMAQRLTWLKAMDEEEATQIFESKHKGCVIKNICLSDRSYEELEALD